MKENIVVKLLEDAFRESSNKAKARTELSNYMHDTASNEELRKIVQWTECRIKELVRHDGENNEMVFRNFSEREIDLIDDYFCERDFALDLMMRNPTEEEIERMGYQNDKLYRLSKECFEQSRNLWRTLLETPYKVDNRCLYDVWGMLRFKYSDETSVVSMSNDDYYGSDFRYMISLKDELISKEQPEVISIVPPFAHFSLNANESDRERFYNELDDGVSWNEDFLRNHAFDKYCICYAMHALHTHFRDYCLPDILRMDNFKVLVRLQYEREECDFWKDEPYDIDPHWSKDVPCIRE